MTKGLVEGFVIWQRTEGYAIGSINMRLSTVKLYCKLAQGAGALDEQHAAMIRTVMGYRGQEGSASMRSARSLASGPRKPARRTSPLHRPGRSSSNPIPRRDAVIAC